MKKIKLQIIQGVEGLAIVIAQKDGCGKRVAGNKPWGGGSIIAVWEVDVEDIQKAIKENEYEQNNM